MLLKTFGHHSIRHKCITSVRQDIASLYRSWNINKLYEYMMNNLENIMWLGEMIIMLITVSIGHSKSDLPHPFCASQWWEHLTYMQKIIGLNPILDSEFFQIIPLSHSSNNSNYLRVTDWISWSPVLVTGKTLILSTFWYFPGKIWQKLIQFCGVIGGALLLINIFLF